MLLHFPDKRCVDKALALLKPFKMNEMLTSQFNKVFSRFIMGSSTLNAHRYLIRENEKYLRNNLFYRCASETEKVNDLKSVKHVRKCSCFLQREKVGSLEKCTQYLKQLQEN